MKTTLTILFLLLFYSCNDSSQFYNKVNSRAVGSGDENPDETIVDDRHDDFGDNDEIADDNGDDTQNDSPPEVIIIGTPDYDDTQSGGDVAQNDDTNNNNDTGSNSGDDSVNNSNNGGNDTQSGGDVAQNDDTNNNNDTESNSGDDSVNDSNNNGDDDIAQGDDSNSGDDSQVGDDNNNDDDVAQNDDNNNDDDSADNEEDDSKPKVCLFTEDFEQVEVEKKTCGGKKHGTTKKYSVTHEQIQDFQCESGKYMFCHFPPGRTEYDEVTGMIFNTNAHVIIISESAVATHLSVGGYLMKCSENSDLKAGDLCGDTQHLCE